MNVDTPMIEIREWGRPARRRALNRPVVVGREGAGELLSDDGVSRRHLRLVPTPTALSVVDLGSRNGTTINGLPLTRRTVLAAGDVVRLGQSEIVVLAAPGEQPDFDATRVSLQALSVTPPPPARVAAPPRWVALAERILGIDPTGARDLFPAFTDLTSRVPQRVWQALRVASLGAYLATVAAMFIRPAAGLFIFFGIIVPLWPITFLVAPGLWRNVCPLSAANQTPRLLGFSRALNPPQWLRNRGYLVAIALFFGIVSARLAGLDRHGAAMGTVLAVAVVAAFAGGALFKGKSGWCSSICPLLPLQRAYGQTPFVTVPNTHCPTCVGCAKNCYDFKPRAAWQADMADVEVGWNGPRRLFVGALPGFVLGFFSLTGQSGVPTAQKYLWLGLCVLVSVGVMFAIDALMPVSPGLLTVGFCAVALNIFYCFAGPVLAASLLTVTGLHAAWLHWPISIAVAALTVIWVARTRVSELQFAVVTGLRSDPVLLNSPTLRTTPPRQHAVAVCFESDGEPVGADTGMSLLDVAEKGGQPLEAGCRMGVCGADPVAVLDGMSCLSPPEQAELNTLRRLGLGDATRMACCARITRGTVTVSLTPEPAHSDGDRPTHYDTSIMSVVVIGNGIAGVTAADFLRRGHPDCEIHLVGAEPDVLYNRMAISRVVYGRSAMQGLYLLPEQWYDDHGVTAWLNTITTRIDVAGQRILLGTGQSLPYDRLILAMGSRPAAPPVNGLDRPGSFSLRTSADAIAIRAWCQQRNRRRAVVAGGGLLGLEAAWALHMLGLHVTVLERGARLLHRQLDSRCSQLVADHFTAAGVEILYGAETAQLAGDPAVSGALLTDGRGVSCEVFLFATGIRPNADLARTAGVATNRGVLVDDWMATSRPGVFAAGDVAEHCGQVLGLWPVATAQAQAAAVNALGGNMTITADTPATILKGVDLELFTIGKVDGAPGDDVIVVESGAKSYRRLVLSGGAVVGATVLGHHPGDVAAVQQAMRKCVKLSPSARAAIQTGDWSALADTDGVDDSHGCASGAGGSRSRPPLS